MAGERRLTVTVEMVQPGWYEAVAYSTLECFMGVRRAWGSSPETALRGLLELLVGAARRIEGTAGEAASDSSGFSRS